MSEPFYSLDVLLATERLAIEALRLHVAERESAREVRNASEAFWPAMMTLRGYWAEEERERRLSWTARNPNPRPWRAVSPDERAARYVTALEMRAARATFKEIGARLDVSAERAGQILAAARRDRKRRRADG